MNSKVNLLLSNLNEQLNFIDLEIDNPIKKCEKALEVILISFTKLKSLVCNNKFKSETEEIMFFKEIKPQFSPPAGKQIELKPLKSYDFKGFFFYYIVKIFIHS